ncbi:hypothetical protein DFJ73DRAFT_946662 [Zopfochytrium polystomum]|nr:hypothetical protein DFJ73DRAFT_946662 [Zopfochytrium polystomum]
MAAIKTDLSSSSSSSAAGYVENISKITFSSDYIFPAYHPVTSRPFTRMASVINGHATACLAPDAIRSTSCATSANCRQVHRRGKSSSPSLLPPPPPPTSASTAATTSPVPYYSPERSYQTVSLLPSAFGPPDPQSFATSCFRRHPPSRATHPGAGAPVRAVAVLDCLTGTDVVTTSFALISGRIAVGEPSPTTVILWDACNPEVTNLRDNVGP